MSVDAAKKAAGEKAATLIENKMVIGLGTGSTVFYFIQNLGLRCRQGLNIQAVASSTASSKQAKKEGIPLADINQLTTLDIAVDGADEIDPEKRMIKGGGGALLREKIIATMSKEMIVVIDETKLSSHLGKRKLPIEIFPFGHRATIHQLEQNGYQGLLRVTSQNVPYITDNGNYIYDIALKVSKIDPIEDHNRLIQIPGVIETGLFFNLATRIIVGFLDGQVVVQ